MAFNTASRVRVVLIFLGLVASANAGLFVTHHQRHNSTGGQDQTAKTLFEEIEDNLGQQYRMAIEKRAFVLETILRPMLFSFHKNHRERFDHAAVRYGLHRLFVHEHAWFVDGLAPTGDNDTASMIATVFDKDGSSRKGLANSTLFGQLRVAAVPDFFRTMFDMRLRSGGLTVEGVAILAAVIENMAATEAAIRLEHAYEVEAIDLSSTQLTADQVDGVVDTYMSVYIVNIKLRDNNHNNNNINLSMFVNRSHILKAVVAKSYPGWQDVQTLGRHTREKMAGDRSAFSFADVAAIVYAAGDAYGRYQDKECRDMKDSLLAIEDDGSGRVSLHKFYAAAVNRGELQFTEGAAYLRMVGALDESNPENPRVIVPNYILAPSNCIASSRHYSVCCIDDCGDLMSSLERDLGASEAPAELIAKLVADLPATYTPSNRTLSLTLLVRLHDIASRNRGMVPLHGRLFAQWMHHAYPRECPYPHVSGTTKMLTKGDFLRSTGKKIVATMDEMKEVVKLGPGSQIDKTSDDIDVDAAVQMWEDEEELYITSGPQRISFMGFLFRCVALFSVGGSMIYSFYGKDSGVKRM